MGDAKMLPTWILGCMLLAEVFCATPRASRPSVWKTLKGKTSKAIKKVQGTSSNKLQKRKASPDKPFSFSQQNTFPAPVFSQPIPAPASGGSYGAPAEEEVDLHKGEFCVDVSTFEPVIWVERDGEECNTIFIKDCQDRSEQICQDVTETKCEVVPYKECKLGLEPQDFTETKLTPKKFVEKACTQGKKTIPHRKLLPECKNVTRQNCVTLWETDSYGKQQWAGTDACEPVTWQECKLVKKDVKFIVPEISCQDKQELWYHEPEKQSGQRMTNTFGCEVKSTSHCTTLKRPDCKSITWKECKEVPVSSCSPKKVHVPTQETLHRKKCLLEDSQPAAAPSYGSPTPGPVDSYSAPAPAVFQPQPSYSG